MSINKLLHNSSRKWRWLAIGLAALAAGLTQPLAADTCIPRANGVPGTLLWQQPPNWWDVGLGAPLYDNTLSDPRWRGTFAQTFPIPGTGVPSEHLTFRGLHRDVGGTTYLYLSWSVEVAPSLDTTATRLSVGFRDPTTSGHDVVIQVFLTSSVDGAATTNFSVAMSTKASGDPNFMSLPTPPLWVTDQTRVWVTNVPNTWAVQMRVPIATGADPDPIADLQNGVHVGNPFRVWYEARVADPAEINSYIPYTFPAGQESDPLTSAPPNPVTGSTENWDEVRLTTGTPEVPDPLCPTTGVIITRNDIGTTNANPRQINLLSPNTFFASPTNQSAAEVTGLKARFRIANWGVQPIWEDSPTVLWDDIASPTGEPAAGISIPASMQGTVNFNWTLTQCERCEFASFYADPDNTDACDALTVPADCPVAPALGEKRDHQCMLVELSGPGITFLNQSVYRNMDFVEASRFERAAQINIKGLGPNPDGSAERDVYLYVETFNMPASVDGGGDPSRDDDDSDSDSDDVGVGRDQPRAGGPETEPVEGDCPCLFDYDEDRQRKATEPTYLVHAYYDTGEHPDRLILRPMTSFGYYVDHEGALTGWEHALKGATLEEIAPNFYRVAVPNDGVAEVKTVIEALEGRAPIADGAWSFSIHAGINDPQSPASSSVDGGFSYGIDLEYAFTSKISLELYLGEGLFDGEAASPDVDVFQVSLNGKLYFTEGNTRWFGTVGVGNYDFSPGSSEVGFSVGFGGQFRLSPKIALEARSVYHEASSSPDFEYLAGLVGVKFFL